MMRLFAILFMLVSLLGYERAFELRFEPVDERDSIDVEDPSAHIDDPAFIRGTGRLMEGNLLRRFSLADSTAARAVAYIALSDKLHDGVYIMQPIGIDDRPRRFDFFQREPGTTFQHSGSISRGFRVGTNRDLSIQSDFNFEAFGKIGDNIEIRAVLSDYSSPLQPEGRTQTLAELDKVYIEAVSPHYSARFGDIDMRIQGSRFLSMTRSAKGVTGDISYPSAGLSASGAVLAGQRITQTINPMEGNQGPYRLKSAEGSLSITVLAGTEKVWIDGRLLERGENNDYTIDYNTAEIRFMPKRPISRHNRIIVDFEYSREDYQSNLFFGDGYIVQDGLANIKVMGYFEADKDPIGFDIDPETEHYLRQLGDNPDSAFIPGWTEDSLGEYSLIGDFDDEFHFVWDTAGQYSVVFTRVEAGSYIDSSGVFVFVGEGEGSFIPYRKITLPKSLNVLAMRAELDTARAFAISGEIATSSHDQNTFSRYDDEDNIGYAANLSMRSPQVETAIGGFSLGYDYLNNDDNFHSPSRIYDADFDRSWGIASNKDAVGRAIHLTELVYLPSQRTSVKLGGGLRQDNDNEDANRLEAAISSNLSNFRLNTTVRRAVSETAERNTQWYRGGANISVSFGRFTPAVIFEGKDRAVEMADTTTGEQFADIKGQIKMDWGRVEITPEAGFRRDNIRENSLEPFSESSNMGMRIVHRNINAYYTHRQFTAIHSNSGTSISTDMADITANFRSRKPNANLRTTYRITGAASEKKTRVYQYVGEGYGDYSFDESRGYYIESGGEYLLEYIGSGVFDPSMDLELVNNFRISSRGIMPKGFPGDISLNLSTSARQSLAERSSRGFLPQIAVFATDSTILIGNIRHRTDLTYTLNNINIRFGQLHRKTANRRWTSGDEHTLGNEFYIQSGLSLNDIRYNVRGDLEKNKRSYPGSTRSESDIITYRGTFEIDYMRLKLFVPRVSSSVFHSENKTGASGTGYGGLDRAYHIYGISIEPGIRASFKNGSVISRFEYAKISSSEQVGIIPYEMAGGRMQGENFKWRFDASYRLTQNSIQTFSYSAEKYPERKTEHRLELKVQYLF